MSDAYANRTDLNNAANRVAKQVVPGQTYGEGTRQMEAQRAVPMGSSPTDAQVQRPVPGTLGALARPTERGREPITAGAPFGPGGGPESLPTSANVPPQPGSKQDLAERVRAIYTMYPNPNLLSLLSSLES
jgi:hypothetical protein